MARQPLYAALYYGGDWHDVAADIRTASEVKISHGRSDPKSEHSPCKAEWTFGNRAGIYNPKHPSSPLFGLAGRNTPVRLGLGIVRDLFDTVVVNGWGAAWSTFGGGGTVLTSQWQVNGGKGKHTVPAANAFRVSYLTAVAYRDVEVMVEFDSATVDVTGGAMEPAGVLLRGSGTDSYIARLIVSTAEAVSLEISHTVAGVLGAVATGITWNGTPLRVRAHVEGNTIRAKAWRTDLGEPYGWALEVDDDTAAGPGWVGVRSGLAVGNSNAPVTFEYEIIDVRDPRFSGEIADWKPRRTEDWNPATGKGDAWTVVEAAGVARRLGQGQPPVQSALGRYITGPGTDPVAYWPMEDGSDSTQAVSGLAGGAPLQVSSGLIDFTDDGPAGSAGSAALPLTSGAVYPTALGIISGPVPPVPGAPWQVAVWCRGVPSEITTDPAFTSPLEIRTDSASLATWLINLREPGTDDPANQQGTTWAIAYDSAGTFVDLVEDDPNVNQPVILDGAWHLIQLTVGQNGANVDVELYRDGVLLDSATLLGKTAGKPTSVVSIGTKGGITNVVWTMRETNIAHVAIYGTAVVDAGLYDAGLGHPGEPAAERLVRLCGEDGIPVSVLGDPADTEPMGPQYADTLVAWLREIERTDGGLLYEQRAAAGVAYRTRASLYNAPAKLTINYTPGEVKDPFDPDVGDLATRNDVTVKRRKGSSGHAVQESGPMNVQEPADDPQGVGRVPTSVDVNTATDLILTDHAGWHRHQGTLDEVWYRRVTVDPNAHPALAAAASSVHVGDTITISNLPANISPDPAEVTVYGYDEVIGSHTRKITFKGAPVALWRVGVRDDGSRRDTAGSTTTASFVAGVGTSLSVASVGGLWTTDGAEMPFDIVVSGVRLTVTAISGASSPQTFTVTATPVNGVTKTIPAGAAVNVWRPAVRAL